MREGGIGAKRNGGAAKWNDAERWRKSKKGGDECEGKTEARQGRGREGHLNRSAVQCSIRAVLGHKLLMATKLGHGLEWNEKPIAMRRGKEGDSEGEVRVRGSGKRSDEVK